jgi:hypothetical protein
MHVCRVLFATPLFAGIGCSPARQLPHEPAVAPSRASAVVMFGNGVEERRLVVDPARHTLRAHPALHLTEAEIEKDSIRPERLTISFLPSEILKPVITLMAWRDSVRWAAAGGSGQEGRFFSIFNSDRNAAPILDWRIYLLDSLPECQARDGDR